MRECPRPAATPTANINQLTRLGELSSSAKTLAYGSVAPVWLRCVRRVRCCRVVRCRVCHVRSACMAECVVSQLADAVAVDWFKPSRVCK